MPACMVGRMSLSHRSPTYESAWKLTSTQSSADRFLAEGLYGHQSPTPQTS
jgi:hypothetical protein